MSDVEDAGQEPVKFGPEPVGRGFVGRQHHLTPPSDKIADALRSPS